MYVILCEWHTDKKDAKIFQAGKRFFKVTVESLFIFALFCCRIPVIVFEMIVSSLLFTPTSK